MPVLVARQRSHVVIEGPGGTPGAT
ncbi:hypothetical protein MILUP08_42099 [Micromonospora lupini str. Lupac 08]|uniref:Uncharacterized protein n=1 Tax=Micromonospora lupini str. Lupac 08 TaxID=1150864 RepID=I0L032_9ACTN|nr:hypothetical protein MILUP08_42099 [Micromonospora lupini str. Lupac 08]